MTNPKKLASGVWVGGEFFPAGSTPDAEVAKQITNPKAWGEGSDADGGQAPKRPAAKRAQK